LLFPPIFVFVGLSLYRYLGVTHPISTDESNEREKEVTITLAEELKRRGTIESEEDSKTR
jgi:poly(A) polymerase